MLLRDHNCPFDGCAMQDSAGKPRPFTLIGSGGNQCAIETHVHAPCREEIDGRLINWRTCRLLRSMRIDYAGGRPA
jgi:hypothetical protein